MVVEKRYFCEKREVREKTIDESKDFVEINMLIIVDEKGSERQR